jgi:hypothetical protein
MAVTQLAVPGQPPHTSARQRRRIWLIAAVLVLAASVVPIWILLHEHSGGDPGGRILGTLVGVRDAIPQGSKGVEATTGEAVWIGSCMDEDFHKGWGGIGVTTVGPTEVDWARRLRQGTAAKAAVEYAPGQPGSNWILSATSPAEPPVGECAGG